METLRFFRGGVGLTGSTVAASFISLLFGTQLRGQRFEPTALTAEGLECRTNKLNRVWASCSDPIQERQRDEVSHLLGIQDAP